MPRAFVLINVESGSEDQVLKDAKKHGWVQEAYVSYGAYDLVIKVKADTMEQLRGINQQLRAINNIRSTLTLILTEK